MLTSRVLSPGFGYGLKLIATTTAASMTSSDLFVDPISGIALTNGGYVNQNYDFSLAETDGGFEFAADSGLFRNYRGLALPDSIIAAGFDVQQAENPLLIAQTGRLPLNDEALDRFVLQQTLIGKQQVAETFSAPRNSR